MTEEKNQASVAAPRPELFREGLEAELNKDREAVTEFSNIEVASDLWESRSVGLMETKIKVNVQEWGMQEMV